MQPGSWSLQHNKGAAICAMTLTEQPSILLTGPVTGLCIRHFPDTEICQKARTSTVDMSEGQNINGRYVRRPEHQR